MRLIFCSVMFVWLGCAPNQVDRSTDEGGGAETPAETPEPRVAVAPAYPAELPSPRTPDECACRAGDCRGTRQRLCLGCG